jgi:hypothetical protein
LRRQLKSANSRFDQNGPTCDACINQNNYGINTKNCGITYIASQVRAFTIAVVHTTSGWVPVVAIIVSRALTVELAIAVWDVTFEGLKPRLS